MINSYEMYRSEKGDILNNSFNNPSELIIEGINMINIHFDAIEQEIEELLCQNEPDKIQTIKDLRVMKLTNHPV